MDVSISEWGYLREQIPTWQQVFLDADSHTKRVLVNKLVERIDINEGQITIRFRIRLEDFISHSEKNSNTLLTETSDRSVILESTKIK